jgi:nucleoid DNA-binding protein
MTYKQLIADIAEQTGLKKPLVKAVLSAAPEALLQMEEGEHVRTPFGTFRKTRRRPRNIKLPDGPVASIDEICVVRLKSGSRLKQVACPKPSPALP